MLDHVFTDAIGALRDALAVAARACDAARASTSLALRLADQSVALGSATAAMQQMRASAPSLEQMAGTIHLGAIVSAVRPFASRPSRRPGALG